jgi:hypothetical protein
MAKPQVKIVNAETGEEVIRDATAAEIAQMETDKITDEAITAAQSAALVAKESAQAKLAALGLTADDLKALGL